MSGGNHPSPIDVLKVMGYGYCILNLVAYLLDDYKTIFWRFKARSPLLWRGGKSTLKWQPKSWKYEKKKRMKKGIIPPKK